MLNMYAPSLLVETDQQLALSKQVVIEWMRDYAFAGKKNAADLAESVANALTDYDTLKSHASPVDVDHAIRLGLPIVDLRDSKNESIRELVWGVAHCVSVILAESNTYKLFESSAGTILAEQAVVESVSVAPPPTTGGSSPAASPPQGKNLAIRPKRRR